MDQPSFANALKNMTCLFDQLLSSLSTLQALSKIRPEEPDQKRLLRAALKTLVEHFGIEYCSIYLGVKGNLVQVAEFHWAELFPSDDGVTLKDTSRDSLPELALMNLALKTCQIQTLTSIETTEENRKVPTDLKKNQPSVVCAPILSGDSCIGLINMTHPKQEFFNEWHLRLLPLFSGFLGQIITTHHLLVEMNEQVKQRTKELETLLTETTHLKKHYKTLSLIDELTGLYNRRYFFSEGKMCLSRAMRYDHPFSLLLLDLDRFKTINDTYGHAVGDRVLKEISHKILNLLRETDLLARVGGEEFAIILAETDEQGASILAERVLQAVREIPFEADNRSFTTTSSIGLVSLGKGYFDDKKANLDADYILDQLFSQADSAMYIAKKQGGNQTALVKAQLL